MNQSQKLQEAKQIVLEVEKDMLKTHKFCPYEIAYTLKSLDEAINFFENQN